MRPVLLLLALVPRVAGLDDCDPDAAASFDGTTASFEALPSVQIGSFTGISVAMWVKHESGVPLLDCSAGAAQDNLVLDLLDGITWSVRVGSSETVEGISMTAAVAFPTNEWKHVMVVQEVGLETTEASIYLDGVLKTSGAVSNPGTVDRDCYLAKFRDSASGEFVGEMCARPPPPHAAHRTPRAAHTPSTPNAAPPAVLQIRRLRLELRSRCYAARRPLAREGRAHERDRRPPRDRMLDALDAEPAAEPAAAEPAAPVLAAGAAAEPAAAEPAAEPAAAEPATALAARPAGPAVPAAAAANVPAEVPGELATGAAAAAVNAAAAGAAADAAQSAADPAAADGAAVAAVRRVRCHGGRGPAGAVLQDLRE